MADDSGQEKTEKATRRKRKKAREKGQVAKSPEIASVLVLLAGISVLYIFGYLFYSHVLAILHRSLDFSVVPRLNRKYCIALLNRTLIGFLQLVLPLMGAIFLTAFAANLYQVGFKFTPEAISPKLSKFNILKGLKRLVSLKSLVELLKSIIKLLIIGSVAYFAVKSEFSDIMKLHEMPVAYIFLFVFKGMFKIFLWVVLIMVLVAVADYSYQKWQFEKDLRMTKQEVKDEHKETEGDPRVKSRIRSIQIQAARKRMMQQVPQADVVVTNPTHLAIAIQYDGLSMEAPQVVAKGAGHVAERIKAIASENRIPVVENKELARNLYRVIEVGEPIPSEFFKAVAELLAYVYKLKGKTLR